MTTPLNSEELTAALERCKHATPGEWTVGFDSLGGIAFWEKRDIPPGKCLGTVHRKYFSYAVGRINTLDCEHEAKANADFIAHSRTDLPRALEANKRWLAAKALIDGFEIEDAEAEAQGYEWPTTACLEKRLAKLSALLSEDEETPQ